MARPNMFQSAPALSSGRCFVIAIGQRVLYVRQGSAEPRQYLICRNIFICPARLVPSGQAARDKFSLHGPALDIELDRFQHKTGKRFPFHQRRFGSATDTLTDAQWRNRERFSRGFHSFPL